MSNFFDTVPEPIAYRGPDSNDPLSFRWYDADRVVAGRTMAEHLRFTVCSRPQPASGRQELLENTAATYIERVR